MAAAKAPYPPSEPEAEQHKAEQPEGQLKKAETPEVSPPDNLQGDTQTKNHTKHVNPIVTDNEYEPEYLIAMDNKYIPGNLISTVDKDEHMCFSVPKATPLGVHKFVTRPGEG